MLCNISKNLLTAGDLTIFGNCWLSTTTKTVAIISRIEGDLKIHPPVRVPRVADFPDIWKPGGIQLHFP